MTPVLSQSRNRMRKLLWSNTSYFSIQTQEDLGPTAETPEGRVKRHRNRHRTMCVCVGGSFRLIDLVGSLLSSFEGPGTMEGRYWLAYRIHHISGSGSYSFPEAHRHDFVGSLSVVSLSMGQTCISLAHSMTHQIRIPIHQFIMKRHCPWKSNTQKLYWSEISLSVGKVFFTVM